MYRLLIFFTVNCNSNNKRVKRNNLKIRLKADSH